MVEEPKPGKEGVVGLAVPVWQKVSLPYSVILYAYVWLAVPQEPLTGRPPVAQESSVPPLVPWQLQSQGPLPVTLDAVPVVQRLIVGCSVRFCPSEEPQAPLTGVPFLEAEQEVVAPPFCPGQVQVVEEPRLGKEGEDGVEVPRVQKVSLPYVVSVYVYVLEAVPQEPAVGSAVAKELVKLS